MKFSKLFDLRLTRFWLRTKSNFLRIECDSLKQYEDDYYGIKKKSGIFNVFYRREFCEWKKCKVWQMSRRFLLENNVENVGKENIKYSSRKEYLSFKRLICLRMTKCTRNVPIRWGDIDLEAWRQTNFVDTYFLAVTHSFTSSPMGPRTRCRTGLVRINRSRRQETTESLWWLRPFNSGGIEAWNCLASEYFKNPKGIDPVISLLCCNN